MKRILLLTLAFCFCLTSAWAEQTAKEESKMESLPDEAIIYFAGGCFWGIEKLMSVVPGVADAVSGYANGATANPTYQEVCAGTTGHRETVRVTYHPNQVSLQALLSIYFSAIDPTQKNQQGNDVGTQYQTGVYYANEADLPILQAAMAEQQALYPGFAVELAPLSSFYEAEAYHQNYLDVHPSGYCHIPLGVIERAKHLIVDPADYQKPADAALKQSLTELQYDVTQNAQTERPFTNEYWDQASDGLYVDITTGEPLFTSADKYQSECGWPAFSKSLDDNTLRLTEDDSHGMLRTEVRSRVGNAHLGHVFSGDHQSPTGTRYCINSASLRFIPYDQMAAEGYGEYLQYVRPMKAQYHKLTPQEAKAMLDQHADALVVDVRSQAEYASGHLPNALLLPLPSLTDQPPALLPQRNATILVYCRSGVRSKDASNKLVAMGYTAVYDIGGIIDWPYEVVTESLPST
ncbi:MAG: peptide-methionine (R)-S-oxide reductase MsrB [Clostridia bacterium]